MKRIIVMYEDYDKEVNMSLYDYVEQTYRSAIPIRVCHVTEEEYTTMQKQIKSGYLNERLPRIRNNDEIGYNKFRYLMAYDIENRELLISDYDKPEGYGSYRVNSEGIQYYEMEFKITNHPIINRSRVEQKIYTTETYEDVIAYYKSNQDKEYEISQKEKELIELLGRSCKTCNTECCGGLKEKGCDRWSHIIHYKE